VWLSHTPPRIRISTAGRLTRGRKWLYKSLALAFFPTIKFWRIVPV
jgi:hypothetical protein